MNQNQSNQENQDIDMTMVFKNIGQGYENFLSWIFRGFLFVKRNIIIIAILFIIGAGLGYFLDINSKRYENKIIVSPNFGSTDYLYSKIDLINSKIKDKDTIFLKETVGIKKPKIIKLIEVKPIIDIYKFIDNKEENFQLIKLMAEDGEIKKIIEDNVTSKNYSHHLITFTTNDLIDDKNTLMPLMNYLNDSKYYKKIQVLVLNNAKIKMAQNDTMIAQIDKLLNGLGNSVSSSQKSDKLIYYNENTQLNDVIKTKEGLIQEQGNRRIDFENLDKVIKVNSQTLNIRDVKEVNGKLKFILPFIFILTFLFFGYLRNFYKKQMLKLSQSTN